MTDTTGRTTQSHEWYQELLGAYALDALLPQERDALEAHLATCAECREELDGLRVGVKAFALTTEERDPSPELRTRVWEAIWSEPNFNRGDTVVAQQPAQPVVATPPISLTEARTARESTRLPLWSKLAAVLAVLLIGGLLAWNVSLRGNESDLEATVVALEDQATTVAQAGEAQTVGQLNAQSPDVASAGEVQYLPERQVMLIELHDLPPLPEGQVYQLWLIVGDQVNPSNVFNANPNPDEPTTVSVVADPTQLDALAITSEPGPIGSISATTDPILVGEV